MLIFIIEQDRYVNFFYFLSHMSESGSNNFIDNYLISIKNSRILPFTKYAL